MKTFTDNTGRVWTLAVNAAESGHAFSNPHPPFPLSRRSATKTENLFQHKAFAKFAKALCRLKM